MDSTAKIVDCLQIAIAAAQAPERSKNQLQQIIGLGMQQALDYLYPHDQLSSQQVATVRDVYRQQYMASNATPQRLFPGVRAMLDTLKSQGYQLSVATGKGRAGLEQAFAVSQLGAYFPISRCASETRSKPDPLMLEEILCDFNMTPEHAVMIGDTQFDIDMGKAAGMDTVAVAQGAHTKAQLQESLPLIVLEQIADLLSWLTDRPKLVH